MLVNRINANRKFRDPIYGYIWLTEDEIKIIDTPLFQRLRRVHQLALSKYVYPNAEHSRFVHSIGVLQSATNIFHNLYSNNKQIIDRIIGDIRIEVYFKTLRFAALLHDVGHVPFSHASEKVILGSKFAHEDVSNYIIENYEPIRNIIVGSGIEPKKVARLIRGHFTSEYSILKKIISGELDADRADYLLRDSHFCGVDYGVFDYERYILSFKIVDDEGVSLSVLEGNLQIVESFLLARFHFNLQVPYHRTRIGYNIALKKYIERLKQQDRLLKPISTDGELVIDFDLFHDFDDYSIFEEIKKDFKEKDYWATILLRQSHLKPLYNSNISNELSEHQAKELLRELIKEGLKLDEDIFYFRKKIEVHKLVQDSDEKNDDDGSGEDQKKVIDLKNELKLIGKNGEFSGNVVDKSLIIGKFKEAPIELFMIFVKKERYDIADSICSEFLKKYDEINEFKI